MAQNSRINFDYDESADVLYITLNTGEPSYCEETDDVVLVERGMFSNQVTGFQIMDVKEHGIKGIQLILRKKIPSLFSRGIKSVPRQIKTREARLSAFIRELDTENLFKS